MKNEDQQDVRIDCLRLLGCLGTIDNYIYKKITEKMSKKITENNNNNITNSYYHYTSNKMNKNNVIVSYDL